MRFWKPRAKRLAALVCALALTASLLPTAVFATEPEPTPTPEPTPVVETTPTPEPSESPENTDATVTTSAPDTGTGSTSAPEATPAGNTDDTKEPVESPEPSEEPTDDTTESGEEGTETTDSTTAPSEEGTETTDSTTVPSEENVEQQVSVPQTLAAAPAAAPETRESKVIYSDADAGINVQLGDRWAGIPQTVTFVVSVDGVQKTSVRLDSVPLTAAPLKVDADNWNCNVYGDGVSVALAVGGYNLTFDSSKDEYTVHIDFKSPTGQLTMKNADGSIDLGTVTYKTGWDQNTTIRVYLNYELVQTFEDVYISASNEVADYNNFQVKTNGDYYLKGVKLVDSSIWGQTVGYTESNQHLFFGLPYQSGENTIALYFFDYKNGVNVDFSRLINDVSFATSELDKACDTLNLSFTYNGRNISYDYNDWGRLYLPKGIDITVTPTIKSGYYFEYWRTSDAAATQNALYSVLPDASLQLEGEGTPFEGLLALTEKMRMHFEDSDYPDMNIHLYMTDGTRHVVHKKITYNSNYPLDAAMADISEQQYFYSPSDGLRHGTRILGEMPAPTGYKFLYWTTGKDGSGTKYMPGDLYGTDGSGDMTLYAQWEKINTPPVEPSVALKKTILNVERDGQEITLNDGDMLKVGDVVTYQIKVTNDGNTDLSNVTVTDTFDGAGGLSFGIDGNGIIKMNGNDFTWTSDVTLNPGESNTLTYTYTVVGADKGKTITNTAAIEGENPTDDGKTETEVEDPDVTVTKSLFAITRNGDSVQVTPGIELKVGDELTYVIDIVNSGNVDLEELTVTDTFSGAGEPSVVTDNGDKEVGTWEDGVWTATIETLPVDGTVTYTYTYTVVQADADKKLTNSAVVTGEDFPDDDPDNPPPQDEEEHEVKDDGKITLRPADITIYMGGEAGYNGVLDGTDATTSNSLPEPGFYITLPNEVNQALGGNGHAADLSGKITVTATTTDGEERNWTLKKYGTDDSTALINGQEHFVYKIEPGEEQPAIRVAFTDNADNTVTSDAFTLTDNLSNEYKMNLYTGDVDVASISLKIQANGQTFYCGYDAEGSTPGTLKVRYAAAKALITQAVTNLDAAVKENADQFYVGVAADQKFYINEQDKGAAGVDVLTTDVSLLADELTGNGAGYSESELVLTAVEEASFASGHAGAVSKYFDLVDTQNGNAWLTPADGSTVTVFWPYPAGTGKDTNFKLYHFDGLDREGAADDGADAIDAATPTEVTSIEKGEQGITFTTSSFSPFVLTYELPEQSQPGDEDKPSGDDDNNNNNNNNNNNTNNNQNKSTASASASASAAVTAPAAPAAAVIPQTGDDMPVGLLAGLALVAAGGLAALLVLRKRRSDR